MFQSENVLGELQFSAMRRASVGEGMGGGEGQWVGEKGEEGAGGRVGEGHPHSLMDKALNTLLRPGR